MCEIEKSKRHVIYKIKDGKIISKTYKHPTPSIRKYQAKRDILKAILRLTLFLILYVINKILCSIYTPIGKLGVLKIAYLTTITQTFVIVMIIITIVKVIEYIILLIQDYRNNKKLSE